MAMTVQPVVIEVTEVSKSYDRSSPLRTLLGLTRALPGRRDAAQVVALRGVSFAINRGESVAIIGRNGSGKSSLLEIIAGTLMPSTGSARAVGRVAALLELGSGFDPGLSGRDNVFMNGLLLGLSRREIRARFDEIAAFADIGDVLDRPVSTYSSGMLVRLAFSVQVALDPDILIVDEALSVGDFFFQQKCATLIKSLRDRGVTLLFVSHDMSLVRDVCTRALLLVGGQLVYDGEVGNACRQYYASASTPVGTVLREAMQSANDVADESPDLVAAAPDDAVRHVCTLAETVNGALWSRWPIEATAPGRDAVLVSATVLGSHGEPSTSFTMGEKAIIRVAYQLNSGQPIHVAVELTNRMGWLVTCIGTYSKRMDVRRGMSGDRRVCDVEISLDVEAGDYSVRVSLALERDSPNMGTVVDSTPPLGPIRVTWDYACDIAPHLGLVGLPYTVSLNAAVE